MDALKAVDVTVYLNTELIVGRKCSSPIDHWHRVQSDLARFTIQGKERREAAPNADYVEAWIERSHRWSLIMRSVELASHQPLILKKDGA
jgi:hypothetical protein